MTHTVSIVLNIAADLAAELVFGGDSHEEVGG